VLYYNRVNSDFFFLGKGKQSGLYVKNVPHRGNNRWCRNCCKWKCNLNFGWHIQLIWSQVT